MLVANFTRCPFCSLFVYNIGLAACYRSSVCKKALTAFASIPPPSGSTASIHRAMAMVCFTSFVLIHTRPFIPIADSSGKRPPRSGRRKCLGLSRLPSTSQRQLPYTSPNNSLSTQLQAALDHESSLHFPKSLGFSCLCVETLKLRLHIFMCEGNPGID